MLDLLLPILFLSGLGFLIWCLSRQEFPQELRPYYWPAVLLKLGAALIFIALYLYYFKVGDVLSYHRQAIRLNELAFSDRDVYLNLLSRYDILPRESLPTGIKHWGNPSSWLLVKLLSFIYLLNASNIWLTALACGFFSFWSMWRLTVALVKPRPDWAKPVLISLFLIPSVLLWTSGISKETIFWAGMGLFLASAINLYKRQSANYWLEILIGLTGLWLSWEMRYFVVAVLIGCLVAWLICNRLAENIKGVRNFRIQVLLFFGVLAGGIAIGPLLHPNLGEKQLLRVIVKSNQDLQRLTPVQDHIIYDLQPQFSSLILNAPKALGAALFRPLPWEADNKAKMLAVAENLVLLGLLILSVIHSAKRNNKRSGKEKLLRVSLWTFVIITAVFLGLATPVFGSLNRYRVCFLPVYTFLLLSSPGISRLLNRKFPGSAERESAQ